MVGGQCAYSEEVDLQSALQAGLKVGQQDAHLIADQFLLGPVFERFSKNVPTEPDSLAQEPEALEKAPLDAVKKISKDSQEASLVAAGAGCPCTWNPSYPCSLHGSCYSLSTKSSCEGHGGEFCGGDSAPSCTCTWNPKYPCSLHGTCYTLNTKASCESHGGEFCGESTPPTPAPPTPPPPTPSSSGSTGLDTQMKAALDRHNSLRSKHQAPDLSWDDALEQAAQSWADKCEWKHSTMGHGENLYVSTGAFNGASAVQSWYDELHNPGYSFANPGFSSGTGHFTQVVWKASTKIGCAVKVCSPLKGIGWNNAKFFVCEYSPAGNVRDEYTKNVLPES